MPDHDTAIGIRDGLSARFADVTWTNDRGRRVKRNICDVCDGNTKAPATVVTFCHQWLGLRKGGKA